MVMCGCALFINSGCYADAPSDSSQKRYAHWLATEAICLHLFTVLYSLSLAVVVWVHHLRISLVLSLSKILFDC